MYFKKLELIGFKSFPEKTGINFEPGTTAIIGPNGCGKTNISDSIRWVLGETSAKSLRGQRMEDVIFNGTELEKPLSMAEVSLTLNNEDKIIPIEYSEVTVTRRCYRSGESDYFINKTPCRLRDIQELFMDTGLGTESYSVMEQGKVDLILSSKPQDRRLVLEEAAGIAKYNSRKEASLRKLELTEQNLLRIDDITAEVKREIISMKRQVTKAEKYRESYDRLKKLELNLSLKKFQAIKNEIENIKNIIAPIKEGAEKLTNEMSREENHEETLHVKLIDTEKALASAREKFLAASEALNTIENREVSLKERMEHLKLTKEKSEKELNGLIEKILDLEKRIEEDGKKSKEVEEGIRESESVLFEKESNLSSLLENVKNAEKEIEEYRDRVFEKSRDITNLNNGVEKINLNLADIERRIRRLNQDKEKGQDEEKEILSKFSELTDLLFRLFEDSQSYAEGIRALVKELKKRGGSNDIMADLIRIETELGIKNRREDTEKFRSEAESLPGMILGSDSKDVQRKALSLEIEELEEEKQFLGKTLLEKRNSLGSLEQERENLKEEVDAKNSRLEGIKADLESAREIKEKSRVSFTTFGEKRHGMEMHLNGLKERAGEYISDRERFKREIEDAGIESEKLKNETEGLKNEKEKVLKEKLFSKEEMERFEEERKRAAEIFRQEEERIRKERSAINKKLEEMHRFELSMAEKGAELNSIRERLSNLYHVDIESETSQDEILNEEEAKTEVERLRQQVEAMGPVNLMAIDENKELEDRFELLKREREDILKAREELHQVINKINATCREKFSETVEKAKIEFNNIFRILFNGGKSDLVLQEGDILESGIEIIARPPGKNPATINQLSGGEKALTAIALLFALFRIRPSPFCVMDEIDAPLDDSNIDRFGAMLKGFLKATQFIIITHNKKTISLAQVIYGITMEEPGISKIVSVRFSDSEISAPSSVG